ncbi:hypothetical protein [Paenibacillus alkalitolerans]|uniref:hypothetical protein n=1 Tax=Paenibacillus alkalitolerans TaxID=2799335 RepID=UPI0018F4AAE3|nr:hypothetical protein [Paenibacillus alkalitolerans]
MFDPTAFDNWKVVVEGALYDLDREGAIAVVGREDLVDLAGMSRSFRISASLPGESARAELLLHSDMADFVGERHDVRLSEGPPGIRIEVRLALPGERIKDIRALHGNLESLWRNDAQVRHSVTVAVDPHNPQSPAAASGSEYIIHLEFRDKWGEDRLGDIDTLQTRLLESLRQIQS